MSNGQINNDSKLTVIDKELEEMWAKPIKPGPIFSAPFGPFKFNIKDEVYATHYKKNGIITHREYDDNGTSQWDQYVVRVIHDDGRSEAYEITSLWLEMRHKAVID